MCLGLIRRRKRRNRARAQFMNRTPPPSWRVQHACIGGRLLRPSFFLGTDRQSPLYHFSHPKWLKQHPLLSSLC